MRAEIITIGDELLIGQVVDTNSAWIAAQLNELGIQTVQMTSIADQPVAIMQALEQGAGRADLVFITGGLGPTKDDITKQALCSYFHTGLRRDAEVLRHVEGVFKKWNQPLLEINKQQADVLELAETLFNEQGTAPGMWIKHQNTHYFMMPGVPYEMKHVFQEQIVPKLIALEGRQAIWHQSMLICGIGESFLAEILNEFEMNLPSAIHLAYLPNAGIIRLRLSGMGTDLILLKQQINRYAEEICRLTGEYFVAYGDVTLEEVVFQELLQSRSTLSTAESCTGGNIGRLMTRMPGSSQVFVGGCIAYSNQVKQAFLGVSSANLEEHGAVSEQVVLDMVEGAKRAFKTDYAVAVSGVAGPDGGSVEKPVGHVWIAISGKSNTFSKLYQFAAQRQVNIDRASTAVLYQLLLVVRKERL